MIVLVSLAAVAVIGAFLLKHSRSNDGLELLGLSGVVGGGVVLAIALVILVTGRMGDRSNIARYHAFKKSVATSRAKGTITEYERAAIQKNIVEWNQDLASVRYWNSTIFDIWTVDELTTLPDIE